MTLRILLNTLGCSLSDQASFSSLTFCFLFMSLISRGSHIGVILSHQGILRAFLVAQMVKNLPANAGDVGSIPGSGRFPAEGNGNHSSILAWEIPWTEEPGRQATVHGGCKRVRHNLATKQQQQQRASCVPYSTGHSPPCRALQSLMISDGVLTATIRSH